jgi:hypothetical protein
MNSRFRKLLLLSCVAAAASLLLTACGAPLSRGVIGSQATPLNPEEWNGRWRSEDSSFAVRVADADNGMLEIAEIRERDNSFQLGKMFLYVREEPNTEGTFFNLLDPENSEQSYTFGRMVRRSDSLVLWVTRPDAMEQLIARGIITGQVTVRDKTKQVTVTGGYEALGRALAGQNGWPMLKLDEPFVYIREKGSL